MEEAYRKVKVRDGERDVKMPTNRAVFRAMANSAIDGNRIAQHLWTQIVRQVEREEAEAYDRYVDELIEFKLSWGKILREQGPRGLLPYPDNIYINPRTGENEIRGPMTVEEQKRLDIVIKMRGLHQENFTRCETALATETDAAERARLMAEMERAGNWVLRCDDDVPERLRVGLAEWEDGWWHARPARAGCDKVGSYPAL